MLNDGRAHLFDAPPGALPCSGGDAAFIVQLYRRRTAGLHGSEITD